MIASVGRILALDWGTVRFGLAVSDETQLIATPLTTITRRPGKRFPMPAFLTQVKAVEPVGIVVGLPLDPSGAENDKTRAIRALATDLERRTGLPVALVDERMSTARALGVASEVGARSKDLRGTVDASAAAVILQQFLESRRNSR